jgi:hypothetical protein
MSDTVKNNENPKSFCRSDRVDETRVGDRLVLYHRDTGTGIVLNPIGSLVWDSLATPQSTRDIADLLARRHAAIPRQQIDTDVATYVQSLREHMLVDEIA